MEESSWASQNLKQVVALYKKKIVPTKYRKSTWPLHSV